VAFGTTAALKSGLQQQLADLVKFGPCIRNNPLGFDLQDRDISGRGVIHIVIGCFQIRLEPEVLVSYNLA
jgi:hypothetical protein